MARARRTGRGVAQAFESTLGAASSHASLAVLVAFLGSSADARSQPVGDSIQAPAEPALATDASKWRFELAALGGWLPSDEFRGGAGLGVGGRYGAFSFGGELWRYRLNMKDNLSGERLHFSATAVLPLVLGLDYKLGSSPLRLGVTAGAGYIYGPGVETATCTTVIYDGALYTLRGSLRWVRGSLAFGPHIGWAGVTTRRTSGVCPILLGPGPDPNLTDYPDSLPLGLELGFAAVLGF